MNSIKVFFGPDKRYQTVLCRIIFGVILIRLMTMGSYPLMDTTESRYAEIAREMAATDIWVTPQLNPGEPFWAKPPLSFWVTAFCFKIFGINEFAARFSSFLFAFLSGWLLFILADKIYGRSFALFSAAVLSTTGLFFVLAGSVMTDPALTFSVTLSLASFFLNVHERRHAAKRLWGYGFFAGLGLGLLAKGPIACVLVFIPVIGWSFFNKEWKYFTGLPWFTGTVLSLIVAVPWYLMAENRTPGFLNYFFAGEHFKRFFVKDWSGDLYGKTHPQAKGMIWIFSIPATLPWLVVFLSVVFSKFREAGYLKKLFLDRISSFFFLWLLAPLIVFTFSGNILLTYAMPALPAFAFLTSGLLKKSLEDFHSRPAPWFFAAKKIAAVTAFVPACFLVASFTFLPSLADKESQRELIRAFQSLDITGRATLIYTRPMPFSAQFYGQQRVLDIPEGSKNRILAELHDDNEDFFAIRKDDIDHFMADGSGLTYEAARFGSYILRREFRRQ